MSISGRDTDVASGRALPPEQRVRTGCARHRVRRRLQRRAVARAGLGRGRPADAAGRGHHGHGRRLRLGPAATCPRALGLRLAGPAPRRAARRGIAVDLATATASPPAWLVRAHPELLPVTADGVRLEFGSRQHYCPSSAVYRAAAARLTRALAERYRDHPALVLWHIHNEYGDHVTECFCAESAADFRRWLAARYHDVETLNHAWGTAFWSQRYGCFEEIEPPRTAPGPGQSDAAARLAPVLLRRPAGLPPRRTGGAGGGLPAGAGHHQLHVDVQAHWTTGSGPARGLRLRRQLPRPGRPRAHVTAAMNYDLMRSLKGGRPWLLMEQAPAAVNWRAVNLPKPPAL